MARISKKMADENRRPLNRYDNDDDSDHSCWMVFSNLHYLDRRGPYLGAGPRSKDGTMIELPPTLLILLFAILIVIAHLKRSRILSSATPRPANGPDRSRGGLYARSHPWGGRPVKQTTLFDRGHRLAGHPSEGLNFSFQGERLGGKFSVLDGVPIALGSPAGGPMHPADAIPSNCRRSAL